MKNAKILADHFETPQRIMMSICNVGKICGLIAQHEHTLPQETKLTFSQVEELDLKWPI
jgi:hypothetical protein